MKPHERFVAWQHCHRLTLFTYQLTQAFPKSELYGITSQMRRSASSAAANIVEGCAKRGASEFRHFLDVALGSLAELSHFALLARDLKLLSNEAWVEFERMHDVAGKTTMGLQRAMARRAARGPQNIRTA
ncbi:MAG: four helix bundle protein [Gemmatimonadetes bacterium]|nr:MAG: four helix bundle protein [Gemmatimonadota bacterium]